MEHLTPTARAHVLDILQHGRDMTLATIRPDGYPQATTVSYIHDGLILYASIGLGSQKAENIQHNNRVSATINLDYDDWRHIRGISLGGTAAFVQGSEEMNRIGQAFLHKFPELEEFVQNTTTLPWPGMLFLCIRPSVFSVLDYSVSFGHTELYDVPPEA
jgi:nitroimidazol reductase NimA-like FMN-containing flavoprotein (pyridoxamine 5'-phosphate oxidase superfamily)